MRSMENAECRKFIKEKDYIYIYIYIYMHEKFCLTWVVKSFHP